MDGSVRAPVHLWEAGIAATLWNGFGTFDYVMTQLHNPAWMAQLDESQLAWIEAAPGWVDASWALGVWGGLAGSLLLLARSRRAVAAFILSLAGLAVNTAYQLAAPMPGGHMEGGAQVALHLLIWAIAILLLFYALRMRRRGVLR